MSRKYSATNKIRFTSISENYQVQRNVKAVLSDLYSSVITYVMKHFDGTMTSKQIIVRIINILTYAAYASEMLPTNWSMNNPFENIPDIDDDTIQDTLGDIYLTVDAIEWDVPVTYTGIDLPAVDSPMTIAGTSFKPITAVTSQPESQVVPIKDFTKVETPSTDLYIQAPEIPQFDVTKPWVIKQCGADVMTIYTTLPEIPQRQRDISITTDVNKMTDSDLLRLYPNHFVRSRASEMYKPQTNMDFDKDFGVILPIDDYSEAQVLDNIIKYPHLYKLVREQNGELVSFYAYMEIDGELVDTLSVWDSLEISKWIPKSAEFIKEYIVRKYLMDIEYKGATFKYPIYGALNPYLTLFMPAEEYMKRGFDAIELAKQCVLSRVAYKQSRSPVLRRIRENE